MRCLRSQIRAEVAADGAPTQAHWRQTIRLPHLRRNLFTLVGAEDPHSRAHRREAFQVLRLQRQHRLWAASSPAQAHANYPQIGQSLLL